MPDTPTPTPHVDRVVSKIVVPSEQSMVALLGSRDEVLRTVERVLVSDVHVRGNEITLTGSAKDNALGVLLFEQLLALLDNGQPLTTDAVERSLAMLQRSEGKPAEVLTLNILSNRGRTIRPKTVNQKRYVEAIDAHTIVFGIGPAGTGKTYLAMAKAVQALQAKQVNRIILTRPAVEAGERLGFLPGTLFEKIDPYLRPLYDALHDMLDPESIPKLMAAGTIEVAPLAYMRGRTLNDAFIILDEAQNTTAEQMKMFLTRLGFGSKIVVTGDVTQVDLPGGATSGLRVVQRHPRRRRGRPLRDADEPGRRPPQAGRPHRRRLRAVRRGGVLARPAAHAAAARRPARRRPAQPVSIEVANESGVEVDEQALVRVARHVLDRLGVSPLAELSLLLVDVEQMEKLHVRWMDEPGPTDVLAFPMDELDLRGSRGVGHGHGAGDDDQDETGPAVLGDVVLCPEVAERQGAEAGPRHRRRARAAVHPRRAAPARLRPRRPRGARRDVRPAGRAAQQLAGRPGLSRAAATRSASTAEPSWSAARCACSNRHGRVLAPRRGHLGVREQHERQRPALAVRLELGLRLLGVRRGALDPALPGQGDGGVREVHAEAGVHADVGVRPQPLLDERDPGVDRTALDEHPAQVQLGLAAPERQQLVGVRLGDGTRDALDPVDVPGAGGDARSRTSTASAAP